MAYFSNSDRKLFVHLCNIEQFTIVRCRNNVFNKAARNLSCNIAPGNRYNSPILFAHLTLLYVLTLVSEYKPNDISFDFEPDSVRLVISLKEAGFTFPSFKEHFLPLLSYSRNCFVLQSHHHLLTQGFPLMKNTSHWVSDTQMSCVIPEQR